MSNVRKVRYLTTNNAVDLYCSIDSPHKKTIYARLPVHLGTGPWEQSNNKAAQWLTTSRWSGGYECDCPVRDGLVFEIVDDMGNVLYEEEVDKKLHLKYMPGLAYAKAPFYRDACKEEERRIAQEFNLIPHEKWRAWLVADMPDNEEPDNWLYCSDTVIQVRMLHQVFILGKQYVAQATSYRHNRSGKEWWTYTIDELKSGKTLNTIAICGYQLTHAETVF